jgi:bacterial/archaeal transporter family protein
MWFYIALLTSFISAFIVIVDKRLLKEVSALVLTWTTLVLATPFIFLFAIKEGIPSSNLLFVIGVTGSVFFYTISKVIGFRAIRMADLSAIYPLTSLGPIFTLMVAFLPPLSEKPSGLAFIGVVTTLFGCYLLNVGKAKEEIFKPIKMLFENKASLLMILSVLIDSIVIIFDKIAINNTIPKNTTFVLLVENLLVIFGLLPILYLRNKSFHQEILINKKLFLLVGLLNAISTILAFSAVGGGNVGFVATILKTQMLLVLFLSLLFFKNRPKKETVIGSVVMILGVILIKVGS